MWGRLPEGVKEGDEMREEAEEDREDISRQGSPCLSKASVFTVTT